MKLSERSKLKLIYFNVILLKVTEQCLKPDLMDPCFVSPSGDLCSILQESCPLAVSIGTATDVFPLWAEVILLEHFRLVLFSVRLSSLIYCDAATVLFLFLPSVNQPDFSDVQLECESSV